MRWFYRMLSFVTICKMIQKDNMRCVDFSWMLWSFVTILQDDTKRSIAMWRNTGVYISRRYKNSPNILKTIRGKAGL
jgi:hypothetical protein